MSSAPVRTILHVDMDAFYASVEQRDDPKLRGRPVIVGGSSRRGVVLAASYEVRPFGVRSAMSMGEALRRAPHALVVPPRRDVYEAVSAQVFAIFRRYTPLVEPLSLDEAFLDVTASRALFGDGAAIAGAIQRDVLGEAALTASAGVAPSKFVAKIASDLRKPRGLVVVGDGEAAAFLAPLPVDRMWGVGPKTAPKMRALGYATIGDLARADAKAMQAHFGTWGEQMTLLARGEDPRAVDPYGQALSVGAEETYERDLVDRASNRAHPARPREPRRAATRARWPLGAHRGGEGEVLRLHPPDAARVAARARARYRCHLPRGRCAPRARAARIAARAPDRGQRERASSRRRAARAPPRRGRGEAPARRGDRRGDLAALRRRARGHEGDAARSRGAERRVRARDRAGDARRLARAAALNCHTTKSIHVRVRGLAPRRSRASVTAVMPSRFEVRIRRRRRWREFGERARPWFLVASGIFFAYEVVSTRWGGIDHHHPALQSLSQKNTPASTHP